MFSNLDPRAGLDAPRAVRTGRQRHDGRPDSTRRQASHRDVWRLDHPHRARRTAHRGASAPQGIERNVVITQWDWADPKAYLHDEISTDKRNPTVNANGLIYGSPEESRDYLPVLDPVHNTIEPGEDSVSRSGHARPAEAAAAVAVLGRRGDLGQPHHGSQSDVRRARPPVVHGSHPRPTTIPAFCKAGSSLPSAQAHSRSSAPAASWRCTIRRPSRSR